MNDETAREARAEQEVESALRKRAKGFQYTEVTEKETKNRTTGEVETLKTTCTKYVPPDVRSAIFWLTNRRPERWQSKPEDWDGQESADEDCGVVVIPEVEEATEPS